MQHAYDSMAQTPETKSFKFQGGSPFFESVRIAQDQQTPRSTIYGAGENETSKGFEEFSTDALYLSKERLSDVHLASRKATEAAARRSQAASWLQKMVGPINLPVEPSEEDLRLCLQNGIVLCNLVNKIHPGAVLKIVENPAFSSPPPQGPALSAYQYFENVRNFLVAVRELKLPSFQASDLEKGSLQMGSSAKVVDCILALKAYHEWQLNGGQGLWKYTGQPYRSPCSLKSLCRTGSSRSSDLRQFRPSNQVPKSWICSEFDRPKSLSDELGSPFGEFERMQMGIDPFEEPEIPLSNTDFRKAWVEHVSQKFDDILSLNGEAAAVQMVETPKGLDTVSSESLLKLIMLSLHGKQPEEIPVLVEFMLRKVMEEFERRLACKEKQWQQCRESALENTCSTITNCLGQQSELEALQMELERLQSINCQRSLVLDSQNNELQGLQDLLATTKSEFQNMQSTCRKEMEVLDSKVQDLTQAAEGYHKVLAENRELYNQVQDLKGNIRVFCRVRPFLSGQKSSQSTVDFIGDTGSMVIANPGKVGKDQRKSFTFNRVFGPSTAQEEVFLDTQPLIRSVLDGFNVCIFAYGQTGSGKTYTMTGPNNPAPIDWGVNFRALNDLFRISQNRKDAMAYEVGVQMMEIYNEQVRDLLCSDGSNKKLEIRNSSQQNGLNVPAASMVSVTCTEDVLELMTLGHKNRAVGATALNERSSRSHSVLTVHVKGTELASGTILRGCLHLVDLAGSERVDKSEATGDRLKEAQHINKSLSALGDVIAALAQKNSHVPYRNSKLTQLLQDSLGGQAKTLMFVHVSPDEDSYLETMSSLKFAERVASVELGAAHSNKESGEVRDLKDQIAFLKDALAKKDAELERFQKELRSKPAESIQEKVRMKPVESLSQVQPQRTSLDASHSQGKRRQPLEEVRNQEIRHTSSNIVNGAQKRLSSADIHLMDSEQMYLPGSFGLGSCEDDTLKRRASKLRRQSTLLLNEEERCAPSIELDAPFSIPGSRKNKIRRETSVEPEIYSCLINAAPERKGDLRASRSFGSQNDATPINHVGQALSLVFSSAKKASEAITFTGTSTSTTMTCSFEGTTAPRLSQSHLKSFCGQDDADDSTETEMRRRKGTPPCENAMATSQCSSEDVEIWGKDPESFTFNHGLKGNNQQKKVAASGRVPTVKQSLRSLPKTESSAPAAMQRQTRSRRFSLIGGTNAPDSEVKKSAVKTTTLEAKLAAAANFSEGGCAEGYAKAATLPRQTTQAAPVQKSSKRWM